MSNPPSPPTRDTFLVFGRPLLEEPEIEEVVAGLRSGWSGTGPRGAQHLGCGDLARLIRERNNVTVTWREQEQ